MLTSTIKIKIFSMHGYNMTTHSFKRVLLLMIKSVWKNDFPLLCQNTQQLQISNLILEKKQINIKLKNLKN